MIAAGVEPATREEAPEQIPDAGRGQVRVGSASLVVVLVLLLTSVFFALPSNVLTGRQDDPVRSFLTHLLPQGWGFFTKPPNSTELTPYIVENGMLEYVSLFPNASAGNMFGLSREQRAQGPEMAILSAAARDWVTCNEVDGDCRLTALDEMTPTEVHNTAPDPTLCGTVVLAETVPVPWAFRHDYHGWRLDERVTVLEVSC